jgi:hypothetical protein
MRATRKTGPEVEKQGKLGFGALNSFPNRPLYSKISHHGVDSNPVYAARQGENLVETVEMIENRKAA